MRHASAPCAIRGPVRRALSTLREECWGKLPTAIYPPPTAKTPNHWPPRTNRTAWL